MDTLDDLRPLGRQKVMDLVEAAGVDVSDWANFKGKHAASNPKYCYEWSFVQDGLVAVFCLWHEDLLLHKGRVFQSIDFGTPRENSARRLWQPRVNKFLSDVQRAVEEELEVRVILCSGERIASRAANVQHRSLDPVPWGIVSVDAAGRRLTIERGASTSAHVAQDDASFEGVEGEVRERLAKHRRRETQLRRRKIEHARTVGNGKLVCEVPNCGFDFEVRYGKLGAGYAHVHHLIPLSESPRTGRTVTLDDVAVVCANCHAMIHLGGECRPLSDLIPK